MKRILENKIRCRKCGDVIESTSVHDFRWCTCKACGVDGGHDYLRRVGEPADWEELSVLSEEKTDGEINRKITSPCPKCGCPVEEIEYLNCGPLVRIRCPKCAFGVNEAKSREAGYTGSDGLFDYWNQLT